MAFNKYFNYTFDANKYSYYRKYPKDFVVNKNFNPNQFNKRTKKLKSGKNDNILDVFINLLNVMNIEHNPLQVSKKLKDFILDISDYIDIVGKFDFNDSVNIIKKKMTDSKTDTTSFNEFDIFKVFNIFSSFVDYSKDKFNKKIFGIKKRQRLKFYKNKNPRI